MIKVSAQRILILLLAAGAVLLISSCDDFFGTEDLKQAIREEVVAATAPEMSVVLRAEKDSMGVPSPYGTQRFKIGVPYVITTTVGNDYVFYEWTHSGAEGDATFGDPRENTTTITINREVEGLQIIPVFDRRPYVVTWTPFSGSENKLINQEIIVTFNEAIDTGTVSLGPEGSVQITTVKTARIATDPKVSVEDDFSFLVNDSALLITLKNDCYHEIFSTITVTLTSEITDLAGNTMTDDFSWFFQTGSGKG
jgi:hypothetical protein